MITSISNILKKNWNTSSQEGKKKKKQPYQRQNVNIGKQIVQIADGHLS